MFVVKVIHFNEWSQWIARVHYCPGTFDTAKNDVMARHQLAKINIEDEVKPAT
jgi:hypothetical protein